MDLVNIDFDWPKSVSVAKAGFRRPRAEIERGQGRPPRHREVVWRAGRAARRQPRRPGPHRRRPRRPAAKPPVEKPKACSRP